MTQIPMQVYLANSLYHYARQLWIMEGQLYTHCRPCWTMGLNLLRAYGLVLSWAPSQKKTVPEHLLYSNMCLKRPWFFFLHRSTLCIFCFVLYWLELATWAEMITFTAPSQHPQHPPSNVPPQISDGFFGWKASDMRQEGSSMTVSGLLGSRPRRSRFHRHREDLCVHQSSWSNRPKLYALLRETINPQDMCM